MSLRTRLATALSYSRRSADAPRTPHRVVVEISNACNLECTFCLRTTTMDRKVRTMKVAEFERIVAANAGTLENVGLNGFGEPLMHPKLDELVAIAHRHGVGVSISTNATLLDEARARKVLASGIDHVTLAIDGIETEQYEAVRVGAAFPEVIENARRFLELKKELRARTFVVVQCIAMAENREHLRAVRAFWRPYGPDAIRIRQLTHTGERSGEEFLNDRGPCYWLWAEPMLLSDGRLAPCCQDVNGELSLGNAFETPLADLWSGQRARELRRLHAEGKRDSIAICRDCNMYQPARTTAVAASLFETNRLNRLVPAVETAISRLRYGR
jgi:radical SAM protein with 4Fe4S-binding SPASM domain